MIVVGSLLPHMRLKIKFYEPTRTIPLAIVLQFSIVLINAMQICKGYVDNCQPNGSLCSPLSGTQ
jgi:hypothetical protein